MNVIIFGSNGMLGTYVKDVFKTEQTKCSYINVIALTRKDYDIEHGDYDALSIYLDTLIDSHPHPHSHPHSYEKCDTYIINCAGAIPQKYSSIEARVFIKLNTLFPLDLERYCVEKNRKRTENVYLIHITTDCVFSGKNGQYDEDSVHDETNIYGVTKSLGEPNDAYVLRTSIIGEEMYSKKSLLEWVISKKQDKQGINGYENHFWNGVTCLTLARIILEIVKNLNNGIEIVCTGVTHIHSPDSVSKYELCKYIDEIYQLNIPVINGYLTPETIDKTLVTKRENIFKINSIKDQIQELWNYHHAK